MFLGIKLNLPVVAVILLAVRLLAVASPAVTSLAVKPLAAKPLSSNNLHSDKVQGQINYFFLLATIYLYRNRRRLIA